MADKKNLDRGLGTGVNTSKPDYNGNKTTTKVEKVKQDTSKSIKENFGKK